MNNNDLSYEKEFGFEGEIVDSKGRKHSNYIHEDYRSVDGYCTEESWFIANEIMYRDDSLYFKDSNSNLIKENKEDKKIYKLFIEKENDRVIPKWIQQEDIDLNSLIKIDDFQNVINIISSLECKFE